MKLGVRGRAPGFGRFQGAGLCAVALSLFCAATVGCDRGDQSGDPTGSAAPQLKAPGAQQAGGAQSPGTAKGPGAQEFPLPVLGRVADFSLLDQNGVPVTRSSLGGKPWVGAFMFTRCPTICPVMTQRMRAVHEAANQAGTPIRMVSFSVDPDHDKPAVLKAFAVKHGADREGWSFVTGSDETVKHLARSFHVALEGKADPNEQNFGILHSGHLVLVDGKGQIRAYYRAAESDKDARIVADAKRLSAH